MRTKKITARSMVCAAALLLSGAFAMSPDEGLTSDRVVSIVRTVNTAEADSLLTGGHLLNVAELPSHRFVKKQAWSIRETDATSGVVGDYRLILTVTPDGKHYQLSLLPTKACGVAAFSNESGQISTGRGLGCATADSQ